MKKWYVILAAILAFIMITSSGAVAIGLTSSSKTGGTSSSATSGSASSSSSSESSQADNLVISGDSNTRAPSNAPLNENPVAEIVSIEPRCAFVGQQISFVGRGRDPENGTKFFSWDFNGDGTWDILNDPVSGPNWRYHYANYTYTSPNTYSVIFRVCDSEGGCTTATNNTAIVIINVDISDNFAGQLTNFTANVQGFSPTKYYWTFGDGQTANTTIRYVDHMYALVGDYSASLKIFEENLEVDIAYTFSVHIRDFSENNTAPYCYFEYDNSDNTIEFIGGPPNSGDPDAPDGYIILVVWDFGDGDTQSGSIDILNTSHLYTITGSVDVMLYVLDNGNPQKEATYVETLVVPDSVSVGQISCNSYSKLLMVNKYTTAQNLMLSEFYCSPMFLKIFGGGTGSSSLGGDCDLNMTSMDPDQNSGSITVTFTAKDNYEPPHYTDSVIYVDVYFGCNGPEVDYTGHINREEGINSYAGGFTFPLESSPQSYDITLTLRPDNPYWNEQNPTDNTRVIEDVTYASMSISTGYSSVVGQSSSQGSYIIGSSESAGIVSTAVEYGSYSL